jgi:arginine/lysine/ornithine decarboxylase
VFYSRSPIGRVFMEHLGEAVFRDDLDNSVLDLGDLLTHEGPALQAQKEAAQIFGAEKTYFVLNGTSTSNKVALGALVTDGDLVLFDRNNHKAAHHGALMINGGVPIYVPTIRNAWGLIGPMRWDILDEKSLREAIRNHPLVTDKDAWRKERPFRVAVVEQCTYDGTIHSAEMILKRIGHLCEYILFDEAWAGFMTRSMPAASRWDWQTSPPRRRASSRRNRPTSSSRVFRRPRRSTSRIVISAARSGASSTAASTKVSCSTLPHRHSTRCSPRSTSARR